MKSKLHALASWLLVILWLAIIGLELTLGSSGNTAPLLQKLAAWLFGDMSPEHFALFHHLLRKTGHFIGFGILGYFWFRAARRTWRGMTIVTCAAFAVACTFLIACLDEWHQSFSPGRNGQFSDVLLDTSGAFVLVLLAMFAVTRCREASVAPS